MENARFVFEGTKFTLKPGQSISHHQSEPDEEGFSYFGFTLSYKDGEVTAECASGGRDCDGRTDRYFDLILTADGWQEESACQRDQYAEAMGY